jgi:hypothetical protein
VNDYLREISGQDFTAKDFRTWAGTVLAAIALREFKAVTGQTQAKKNVVTAIEAVAKMLGNTPAVCRKCYIHPRVLESYLAGNTIATIRQRVARKIDRALSQLKPEEAAVLVLIQRGLETRAFVVVPDPHQPPKAPADFATSAHLDLFAILLLKSPPHARHLPPKKTTSSFPAGKSADRYQWI